jgi:hypothetical protein
VEVGYTRGFDKVLNGNYAYDKWIFAIHQTKMIRRLGKLTWRVEGGKVTGNVPFAKLFTLNQGGGGLFYVPNTFQTLKSDTAWLSDKFLNVYFTQSFGNIWYRAKYSAPQLAVAQNIALGQLLHPEVHQGIAFATPNKPILESGIVLHDILRYKWRFFDDGCRWFAFL